MRTLDVMFQKQTVSATSSLLSTSARQRLTVLVSAIFLPLAGAIQAMPMAPTESINPRAFPDPGLHGWTERSFAGNTDYRLVEDGGVEVLRGHARSSASILYKEREIDLLRTPIIEWSWKVDRVFSMIDERTRGGDDFPARLYVVARMGFLPWETLAINYVWASEAMPGDSWLNPYTSKAMMIAVRSGPANVGEWKRERRDIRADFLAAFGKQIDKITGYAVMVDGDNAQLEATAWFGDLAFHPR